MGGAVGVSPVTTSSSTPAAGGKSSPAGSNDYANAYYNAGGIGGGLNVAQYNPSAAPQGMMGGKGPAAPVTPYAAPAAQTAQPVSPMVQQMQQPGQPIRGIGPSQLPALQSLLNSLAGGYDMGQQSYSPMPTYQSQALNYRPNLSMAQQSLGRTATTQAEAQAAAAAKKAALEQQTAEADDFARWQREQYANYVRSRDSFYSGG